MESDLYSKALGYLRKALGNPDASFRDGQWESIERVVKDKARLLLVQRTGWGKSMVYFIATRLLRDSGAGPTLLISPLLSLIRDQIKATHGLVRSASIHSKNKDEWPEVYRLVREDRIDVLLISPERLGNAEFQDEILTHIADRIGLFVVDEAHCISDWGHDFRPDYRRITRILQALPPNMPILATTATANDRVVNDIVAQLGSALMVLRGPLARRSLRLQNIYLPSQAARLAWLAERLPELPGTGIVYVLTKADAERVAAWLQSCGINAMPYHSKTGDGEGDDTAREELEALLRNNEVKALVATVALGMGFDKPDIGFVIHFQRPGSAVHYYQQVGRAGRALDLAYGILLSGVEDEEITEYFIRSSFPPEGHVDEVLKALGKSADGLSIFELQNHVNLNHMEIEKVLKLLSVESPSPVVKEGSKWKATYVAYKPDRERINQLTALRRHEQERMREYMKNTECLMTFLRRELSDPDTTPCGKCAVCVGKPLLPETFSDQVAVDAVQFLRRSERTIEPRKKWLGDGIVIHGWKPNTAISDTLRPQAGKALCFWGDAGWGDMVRRGKMEMGRFDDALVVALSEMILDRWKPSPMPTWVTCVPSLTRPMLVSDLARRLAGRLGLQFVECVLKIRNTLPQKAMNNSAQQAGNIAGAFEIKRWPGIGGPVLLVDDMVDSRWTFTVISALLRSEGSGPVFPTALAMVQFGQD